MLSSTVSRGEENIRWGAVLGSAAAGEPLTREQQGFSRRLGAKAFIGFQRRLNVGPDHTDSAEEGLVFATNLTQLLALGQVLEQIPLVAFGAGVKRGHYFKHESKAANTRRQISTPRPVSSHIRERGGGGGGVKETKRTQRADARRGKKIFFKRERGGRERLKKKKKGGVEGKEE